MIHLVGRNIRKFVREIEGWGHGEEGKSEKSEILKFSMMRFVNKMSRKENGVLVSSY